MHLYFYVHYGYLCEGLFLGSCKCSLLSLAVRLKSFYTLTVFYDVLVFFYLSKQNDDDDDDDGP